MIFWFVASAALAAVLYALTRPLFGAATDADEDAPVNAAAYDVAVFKSQLREVERDLERGRITAEESEASRVEIGRRLLAADRREREAVTKSSPTLNRKSGQMIAGSMMIGAFIVAILVYGRMGNPSNPDMPLALRQAELQLAAQNGTPPHAGQQAGQAASSGDADAGDFDTMASQLRARLTPGDGNAADWSLLGRTELMRGNYAEAANAYAEALKAFPDDSTLNAAYGEALVLWADGTVNEQAQAAFRKVLSLTPGDPRARFYLAEFQYQDGKYQVALDQLIALLQDAAPDAPWFDGVLHRTEALAAEMGVDIADQLPDRSAQLPALGSLSDATGGASGRGPTAEDMAAAADMTPEERQDMIRGMVDGLAARLAEDPSDFDGWLRLIRSRATLGEMAAAQESLDTALVHFANAPFPTRQLQGLAAELGLNAGNGAATAPRGPSAADIAAADEMSKDERITMIEGMVGNLAAKLSAEPNNPEGWLMLARSYAVLGRNGDAIGALARASELQPDNVDLLLDRARLMRTEAGERQTAETVALMARVETLDPDNIEALWFLGLDAFAADRPDDARGYLDRALAALPVDSPEHASLQAEINRLFAGAQ